MANNKEEWISALTDGEVQHGEFERVLKSLREEDELRGRWARYHLIRDALHNNLSHAPADGFSQRVSAALEQEPVILAPKAASQHSLPHQWVKQTVGVAVAASVAAVAILTVQNLNQEEELTQVAEVTVPQEQEFVRLAQPVAETQVIPSREFENYLAKHNAYSAVTRTHDVMPFARIVSHDVTR